MTQTAQPHALSWIVLHVGDARGHARWGIQRGCHPLARRVRGRPVVREHPRGELANHRARRRLCLLLDHRRRSRHLRWRGNGHQFAHPSRGARLVRSTRTALDAATTAPPARGVSLQHGGGRCRVRCGHDSLLCGLDGRGLGVGCGADALCCAKRYGRARQQREGADVHLDGPVR